jgi:hypothetical protein
MADSTILQDLRPFSLQYPANLSPRQRRAIYEGQVRAFLEASEIVEIEEEVLDDILDGFQVGGFDEASDDTAAGENMPVRLGVLGGDSDVDAAGNIELPLPCGFYVFFGPPGMTAFCGIILWQILLCCGVITHFFSEPLAPRWAKQQINGMLAHLKQRGEPSPRRFGQR